MMRYISWVIGLVFTLAIGIFADGTLTFAPTQYFQIGQSQGLIFPSIEITSTASIATVEVRAVSGAYSSDRLGFSSEALAAAGWTLSGSVLTRTESGTTLNIAVDNTNQLIRIFNPNQSSNSPSVFREVLRCLMLTIDAGFAINGNLSNTRVYEILAVEPSTPYFLQDNLFHLYRFVSASQIDWTEARDRAGGYRYWGRTGYLATITSAAENANIRISSVPSDAQGWLGGSDAAVENQWRWVTGPEAGTLFVIDTDSGAGGAVAQNGLYQNFNPNQPDNNGSVEHYLQMVSNDKWNDLPNNYLTIQGYFIEFGGLASDQSSQVQVVISQPNALRHASGL